MRINCIIPVYNVERFLPQCIDSVLNQSYKDFKIILINDCSPDGSLDICRKYEAEHPDKIVLIDKPVNEGVDKARFTGLDYVLTNSDLCGGILFLDSDDYLSQDAFRQLHQEMVSTGADVVEMRTQRVLGPIKRPVFSPVPAQVISRPRLMDDFYISFFGINLLTPGVTGRLYKTELLKSAALSPSEFKMGEDLMFIMRLFPCIEKLAIIDYPGYNYRIGGLTSRYNPTFWDDLKCQYAIKRAELVRHNYDKGFRPLAIELINIFYTSLQQRIYYLNETKGRTCTWIKSELVDKELWKDVADYSLSEGKDIVHGDVEAIYAEACTRLRAGWKRRLIKKILTLFLK